MAVKSTRLTVGTTRAALTIPDADYVGGSSLEVYVVSGGPLYVGGADVTAANGRPVAAGASVALDLRSGEAPHGICDTATTAAVALLGTGV